MSSLLPSGSDGSPKLPMSGAVPQWVWGVFVVLFVASVASLLAALWLGQRMHMKAEGGAAGHSTYAVKRERNLAPVERVTPSEPATMDASSSVPFDMPMVPTEVPPPLAGAPVHVEVVAGADSSTQPVSATVPLAVEAAPEQPRWVRNAVPVDVAAGAPRLAIVIDDMGLEPKLSQRAVEVLPGGVTLSFLPYGSATARLAELAHAERHEILIHLPMEPLPHGDQVMDMGPHGLKVGMTPDVIAEEMARNMASLTDLAVGVNNHMGSRFTGWSEGMRAVLTVLQKEGMLFLDSKTAAPTATQDAAAGLTLPVLSRDVFLDHVMDAGKVRAELDKAVKLARKRGYAVAIGHPLPVTLDVLEAELPGIVSSGVVLVPVSQLIAR